MGQSSRYWVKDPVTDKSLRLKTRLFKKTAPFFRSGFGKLSLKPFQVNAIIKSSATQTAITKAESGELAAITHYKNDMGEAKQCNKLDSNFSKFQFVTSPEEFKKLSPKKREIQKKEVIASCKRVL